VAGRFITRVAAIGDAVRVSRRALREM